MAAAFAAWLQPLETISWGTYIEKPPEDSTPEHVLKYLARYLARYLAGGPISDRPSRRVLLAPLILRRVLSDDG